MSMKPRSTAIRRLPAAVVLAAGLVATTAFLGASAGATTARTAGGLAGVCPNPIRIALDWTPQAELGGYYQLAAANGKIDASQKTYTAPLVDPATGKKTGVDVELLAGGPAVGYLLPQQTLYQQTDVLLGVDATDTQITAYHSAPTVAIAAPMELYPTILFWNPDKLHFTSIKDIGKTNTHVLYYTGAGYMDYLIGAGVLKKSQTQGGYNGSPGIWVSSGGGVVSQGFAESEPYIYTHELPAWNKTVAYELVQNLGYQPYEEVAITKPENVTRYAACFKKLVPMIQRAEIAYAQSPGRVNGLIVKLIDQYKVGGPYSAALARYSIQTQLRDRIISQPKNGGFASFDMHRVNALVKAMKKTGAAKGLPAGFSAKSIATNRFIDPKIKMTFYKGPYNDISHVITVKGVNG